jgi:hypothetical protein
VRARAQPARAIGRVHHSRRLHPWIRRQGGALLSQPANCSVSQRGDREQRRQRDANPGEPTGATGEARAIASGPNVTAHLDAADILASVGEALYPWDIASDALIWSANVRNVLLVKDIAAIATGRRYAQFLDAAKGKRRGSFFAYQPNLEREALRRDNMRATDEIVTALNERRVFLAYEKVVASGSQPSTNA